MEQDLNQYFREEKKEQSYFKPEYKDQNVKELPEFKKWYENNNKYINEENRRRTNQLRNGNVYNDYLNNKKHLLLISFCPNCSCYVICYYSHGFSFVDCSICKARFCYGCLRKPIYEEDDSTCFEGFFKIIYLRVIYDRTYMYEVNYLFYIIHILFFIFLTPLFALFITVYLGYIYHPNIKHQDEKLKVRDHNFWYKWYSREQDRRFFGTICGAFLGFLMFPYIITFFPFMILLFLPSIFSSSYYKKIYLIYNTIICPGTSVLK